MRDRSTRQYCPHHISISLRTNDPEEETITPLLRAGDARSERCRRGLSNRSVTTTNESYTSRTGGKTSYGYYHLFGTIQT